MIDIRDWAEWINGQCETPAYTRQNTRSDIWVSSSSANALYGTPLIFEENNFLNQKIRVKEEFKDVDVDEFEKILNGG